MSRPTSLVVDEVGYLTYSSDAANMLFHVVNTRHRHQRSMIFTTNKALDQWGNVLHHDDLAQAIIDRSSNAEGSFSPWPLYANAPFRPWRSIRKAATTRFSDYQNFRKILLKISGTHKEEL